MNISSSGGIESILFWIAALGGWGSVVIGIVRYIFDISGKRYLQREASKLTEEVNHLAHEFSLRQSSYTKYLDLLLEYYSNYYRHYRLCQYATQDRILLPDGQVKETRDRFFKQLNEFRSELKAAEGKIRMILPSHLLALHEESIDAFNEFKDAMNRTTYDEAFHETRKIAFEKINATKQRLETALRDFLRTEHLLYRCK